MNLDELASDLHEVSIANGFYEGELNDDKIFSKMAFLTEEIGELVHSYKKDQGSNAVSQEIADIIIRALDLHEAMRREGLADTSIHDVLLDKHTVNKSRGYLHGNSKG